MMTLPPRPPLPPDGPPRGHELLLPVCDYPVAAVPGLDIYFNLVNKLHVW